MPSEKITRRHLPHWFVPGAAHFVTYRLAGTIPLSVLQQLRRDRDLQLERWRDASSNATLMRERIHKQFFGAFDKLLDSNREIAWLADPRIATVVRQNLFHHRGVKYHLFSYCIMPNHVHVVFQPIVVEQAALPVPLSAHPAPGQAGSLSYNPEQTDGNSPLAKIMHSLKSYTANEANKILGRLGETFWQSESYDHWVRDDDELERIVDYIAYNPVKAGLVSAPHEWQFCSAHDRFHDDGEPTGWLRQS